MQTATLSNGQTTDLSALTGASVVIWKYEWSKSIKIPPFGPTLAIAVGVYVDYLPDTKSFDLRLSATVNGVGINKTLPFSGNLSISLPLPLGIKLNLGVNGFNYAGGMLSFDITLSVTLPIVGTITIISQRVVVRVPSDEELAAMYAAPASHEEFQLRLAAFA